MTNYYLIKEGKIIRNFNPDTNGFTFPQNGELIDEEEKMYRAVAWCSENGFDYEDILEDEEGEFVFDESQDYAHPSDEGASTSTKKIRVTYFPPAIPLKETVKEVEEKYVNHYRYS